MKINTEIGLDWWLTKRYLSTLSIGALVVLVILAALALFGAGVLIGGLLL